MISKEDQKRQERLWKHSSQSWISNNRKSSKQASSSSNASKSWFFSSVFGYKSSYPSSVSVLTDGSRSSTLIFTTDQLSKITFAADCMLALRSGLNDRGEDYCIHCVDVVSSLCEFDPTMAEQLGLLGVCSLLDQILGTKITSPSCCESCLRAMV